MSELKIPEDLQKQWIARHLLEPPAPEVVGEWFRAKGAIHDR